ncbi:hypothetical protein CJ030_MR8G022911 [Morella rubra]|uniref:Uncharacterized protein n=1 Tax=Morella rubra TaxID=262757 RepID=A0A6A1USZ1_9ROSI|nr:hypothetical protein CJ030_MR8G022911 [Morella rubra]
MLSSRVRVTPHADVNSPNRGEDADLYQKRAAHVHIDEIYTKMGKSCVPPPQRETRNSKHKEEPV